VDDMATPFNPEHQIEKCGGEQIIYQLATFFAMTRTIDTKLGPGIPIPRLRSNPVAVQLGSAYR